MSFKGTVTTLDTLQEISADCLIDSGCQGSFIDIKFVQDHGINTTKLPCPIKVFNADGQENIDGPISEMVTLHVKLGDHMERLDLGVTNLGRGQIFLGHDWLQLHNPLIDWHTGTVTFDHCPSVCQPRTQHMAHQDLQHLNKVLKVKNFLIWKVFSPLTPI